MSTPPAPGRHRRPRPTYRRWWLAALTVIALVASWRASVSLEALDGPATGSSASPPAPPTTSPRGPDPAPLGVALAVDARQFAPGTCQKLPALGRSRGVVVLDAGHGGRDPGAVGTTADGKTLFEKDATRAIVDAASPLLRRAGFDVVTTRPAGSPDAGGDRSSTPDGGTRTRPSASTVEQDLTMRARCANAGGGAALVSVHANSFEQQTVRGAETVYEQHRALAPKSASLARELHAGVLSEWRAVSGRAVPDRGLVDDSSGGESVGGHLMLLGPGVPGYIDHPTRMPAALIEPAFITHPADATLLSSPSGVQALARAVSSGVDRFMQATSP